MKSHPYSFKEPWDYELSTGRRVGANVGYIGLSERDGVFSVSEGYDGQIDFGENLACCGAEFVADIWTVEERIELADFMIARWTAFREKLKENAQASPSGAMPNSHG